MALTDLQSLVASVALRKAPHFALAGSGALQAHGIGSRRTDDVDLFTNVPDETTFKATCDDILRSLHAAGFETKVMRSSGQYAKLLVFSADGSDRVEVDLGYDWRAFDPVFLEVGPVLDRRDAVGNKVAAVFSRGETRDFVDLDSIRETGIWTDTDLIALATERDPGFDVALFRQQVQRALTFSDERLVRSGVQPGDVHEFRSRLSSLVKPPAMKAPVADQVQQRHPAGATDGRGGEYAAKRQTPPEIELT